MHSGTCDRYTMICYEHKITKYYTFNSISKLLIREDHDDDAYSCCKYAIKGINYFRYFGFLIRFIFYRTISFLGKIHFKLIH